MSYTVEPTNPLEPTDDREAGMMAAEFRTIKGYLKNTLLKAITDNKTASDDGLKSINDKLNTATGNADLPATTGLIPIVAGIYKALYTEGTGVIAKLSSVSTKVDQQATALEQANQTIANLNSAMQQLSQSFTALNNKFNQLTGDVDSIILELPVGYVLITKNSANPATYLKYGEWKQVCKGTYLVGVGASTYSGATAYNFTQPGGAYGEPSVSLTVAHLPKHRHASNVIVRTQKLTSVDGEPTGGDGVKVIIGYDSAGNPIYGSESSGAAQAYYTTNYEGTETATWENPKDYGKSQQRIPYTSYAGGQYTASGLGGVPSWSQLPVRLNPLATAYYMWERTA